jgi:hypothetical protein
MGIQRTVFNLDSEWKEAASSHGPESIYDFLATVRNRILLEIGSHAFEQTLAHIQLCDCYHSNARFRDEHEAEFGLPSYVELMIQYK